MNFITEKLYFTKFKRTSHLTTGEIALWEALFMASNSVGLGLPFQVPDQLLCVDTSLSQSGLAKARKGLIRAGLLTSTPYRQNKPRTYRLVSLEEKMQKQYPPKTGTATGCQSVGTTQSATQSASDKNKYKNKKQNKTKQKNRVWNAEERITEDDLLAIRLQEERIRQFRKEQKEREMQKNGTGSSCSAEKPG